MRACIPINVVAAGEQGKHRYIYIQKCTHAYKIHIRMHAVKMDAAGELVIKHININT
jgi:hypothetical protein